MADDTLQRFSVSLPAELLEELDRRVTGQGYASRSELIRDLIRERLVAEKWAARRSTVFGTLTLSYDHHQRGLADRLTQLQHNRHVNVLCSTHVHVDHDHCLEVILLRGRPDEIEKLAIRIGGLKGVRFSRLTRASTLDA
ncbi:MAG: nickel-responsive transcriptional regulator NikR [Candidatus Krumholzibacteriia bacterium]|nr:nickel-responsive transcriptional regulator NikR [Candidatus Latescibacterota bacterium]MCB9515389.1 nickel-responsive transcriptional regulator NikR [Candidatus Latescibacterota bacterium]